MFIHSVTRRISTWAFVTVSTLISGCVVIPVPASEERVVWGHPVVEDHVRMITAGGWDTNDVKALLGEPFADFGLGRVYIYGWRVKKGSFFWFAGGGGGGAMGMEPWVASHLFFVAFDVDGIVLTAGTADFKPSDTLARQVRNWLASVQLEETVVSPRLDHWRGDRALLVVYRPSTSLCPFPTFDSDTFKPSVDVDGVLVGDLAKGEYLTAEIKAGTHAIAIDPVPNYQFAGQESSMFVQNIRKIRVPGELDILAVPGQPTFVETYLCTGTGKIVMHLDVPEPPAATEALRDLRPAW